MIRVFAIAAALIVVLIVLYLPAAHPPDYFVERLKREHELNVIFFGTDAGYRILARMLDLQASIEDARGFAVISTPHSLPVDTAVAGEVSRVSHRILTNQYFRSVDTLMTLASYRLAVLLEWVPLLAVFLLALLVDGYIARAVRSRQFMQHNPELFGLCLIVIIGTVCATLVASVMPLMIHPLVLLTFLVLVGIAGRGAVANYHRRA